MVNPEVLITPETEVPEEAPEKTEDIEETEEQSEAAREQEAVSKSVQESAHELEELAATRLDTSIGQQTSGMATAAAPNPMETIQKRSGGRYDTLRTQLLNMAKSTGTDIVNAAKTDLLATLLGHDLTEGQDPKKSAQDAATLLAHTLYAAQGKPLPALANSAAEQAVKNIGAKLTNMSDRAFWDLFSSNHDGAGADNNMLRTQIAIMGMAGEFRPLTENFNWPTDDVVTSHVDQLIAAATMDPDFIDLSAMYRRASTLSLNGKSIPRAIMTDLVRMAMADLIARGDRAASQIRTPLEKEIQSQLAEEPNVDTKSTDRNSARKSAKALLKALNTSDVVLSKKVSEDPNDVARREQARASRGRLKEAVEYLKMRVESNLSALSGGDGAVKKLNTVMDASGLLAAVELWSEAYRSAERDPVKLKMLLDNVTNCGQSFASEITKRFPNSAIPGIDKTATMLLYAIQAPLAEIAFEAVELLGPNPDISSSELGGAALTAEQTTKRSTMRREAMMAINKGGLPKFIDANVPTELRSEPWVKTLSDAATNWNVAETRDANEIVKAASAFTDALSSIKSEMGKNWKPEVVFLAEGVIDALATAITEKVGALSVTEPQIKKQLSTKLTTLVDCLLPEPKIDDMRAFWDKTKSYVQGASSIAPDLVTKLSGWQNAFNNPADTVILRSATYIVVDALVGTRLAVAGSKLSDSNKIILLRALDDIGSFIASKTAGLVK